MSTIASLSVALDMDTARFSSGTRRAQGDMRSLASTASVAAGAVAAAFLSNELRQAIQGASREIAEATNEISQLVDQADRLGTSVAPLAALQRSAGQAGAEFQQLTKGLDRLQRTLGSGAAGKTLKTLGLDLQALRGKSVDEAFLDVADAIRNIDNEAGQAAASYALFGRSGQELTVLLKQGSEELRRQAVEARRLGLTLDDAAAGGVESMGDAWEDAKNASTGLWRQITASLAPALHGLADTGTELITDGAAVTASYNSEALAFEKAFAQVRQGVKDYAALHREQAKAIDTTSELGRLVGMDNFHQQGATEKVAKAASDAYSELRASLKEEIELFGKSKREIDLYNLSKMGGTRYALEQASALAAQLDGLEREKAALEKSTADRKAKQEELAADAKSIFEATRTPQEQYAAEMARLNTLVDSGALSWDVYGRAALQAMNTLADAEKAKLPQLDTAGASPAALEKGSVGAASAVTQQRQGLKRLEDLERQGLTESQQQTALLKQIATAQTPTPYSIPT